jgi:hypothetical protein
MKSMNKYRVDRLNRRLNRFAGIVSSITNDTSLFDTLNTPMVATGAIPFASMLGGAIGKLGLSSAVKAIGGPMAVLFGVQILGMIGSQVSWGLMSVIDDINYAESQLEGYINTWGKNQAVFSSMFKNDYDTYQRQFDKCLDDCKSMQKRYTELDGYSEKIKQVSETAKTDPEPAKKLIEEYSKKIEDHTNFCNQYLDELRSITGILKATRSWFGAGLDETFKFVSLDWVPWITTYSNKLEQTLNDLYTKLESHFGLLKEYSMALKEIDDKIKLNPKTDAATNINEEELKKLAISGEDKTSKEQYLYADVDGKKEKYIAWDKNGNRLGIFDWSETSPVSKSTKPIPTAMPISTPTAQSNSGFPPANFLD